MGKMRPLKLETLWIVPALYLVVAALMFVAAPADRLGRDRVAQSGWRSGAAVGWQRGKMMHIHVDPETHALNQKASPAAMIFLIALIVVRSGARGYLGARRQRSARRCCTDPLIAFALGMFTLHAARDVSAREAVARRGARPS